VLRKRSQHIRKLVSQFSGKSGRTEATSPASKLTLPLAGRILAAFRRALLQWFAAHRRALPWRQTRDPYRIWVAEIMLQQTRIAAVIPYYERFLERFPGISDLAGAEEAEVLRLWSGLGYYQRARNLQRAARKIVESFGGEFPRDAEAARMLPGIGNYTLAAVLSIASGERLAALDGNIARVLARLGAVRTPLREPRTWRKLQEEAQRLLARDHPGDWNQALMELGETVCTPHAPRCDQCPVSCWCRARELGLQDEIPVKRVGRNGVRVTVAAAVLCDARGRTLLLRVPGRHDAVLFSRLRQFPAVQVVGGVRDGARDGARDNVQRRAVTQLNNYLRDELGLPKLSSKSLRPLPALRHAVTFRDVVLLPVLARVPRLPKHRDGEFASLKDVPHLPISSATRKIARAALAALATSPN
jgi:A/G-specific adenine glycosylase